MLHKKERPRLTIVVFFGTIPVRVRHMDIRGTVVHSRTRGTLILPQTAADVKHFATKSTRNFMHPSHVSSCMKFWGRAPSWSCAKAMCPRPARHKQSYCKGKRKPPCRKGAVQKKSPAASARRFWNLLNGTKLPHFVRRKLFPTHTREPLSERIFGARN